MRRLRYHQLRDKLTFSNVTAALALFIALGGTSYAAITLPRNSVGSPQIRTGAIKSAELRDRAIKVRDLASSARSSLRGPQGPQGPAGPAGPAAVSEFVRVNSGGDATGTTTRVTHTEVSVYSVTFNRDVSACAYSATLARVPGGVVEDPPPGRITIASAGGATVAVKTFDPAGNPADLPFHLIVAC